jgi:L-aspartate oxidase
LDPAFVKNRFPRIFETCLKYGIDIAGMQIPVSPAAHYIMGGIKTDLNGKTNIPGLFAAGETACTGVHGANRLASNSLLEGLVYGYRTAAAAASYGSQCCDITSPRMPEHTLLYKPDGSLNMTDLRNSIRDIMWESTGIIRSAESLGRARQSFVEMKGILDINFDSRCGVELRNLLTVAIMITEAALFREGSIGAHCRSDFPSRGNDWQRHTNIIKSGEEVKRSWT